MDFVALYIRLQDNFLFRELIGVFLGHEEYEFQAASSFIAFSCVIGILHDNTANAVPRPCDGPTNHRQRAARFHRVG